MFSLCVDKYVQSFSILTSIVINIITVISTNTFTYVDTCMSWLLACLALPMLTHADPEGEGRGGLPPFSMNINPLTNCAQFFQNIASPKDHTAGSGVGSKSPNQSVTPSLSRAAFSVCAKPVDKYVEKVLKS